MTVARELTALDVKRLPVILDRLEACHAADLAALDRRCRVAGVRISDAASAWPEARDETQRLADLADAIEQHRGHLRRPHVRGRPRTAGPLHRTAPGLGPRTRVGQVSARSVDEIRADLAAPMVAGLLRGGVLGTGPVQRLVQDLNRLVDGAADEPGDPALQSTAAQRWRRLLEMPAEQRLERLEHQYEAALRGSECFAESHVAVIEQLHGQLH